MLAAFCFVKIVSIIGGLGNGLAVGLSGKNKSAGAGNGAAADSV